MIVLVQLGKEIVASWSSSYLLSFHEERDPENVSRVG
jgi:hypothetical protein